MASHLIDYDAEFGRRITRDQQHIKWSVIAFAIAVVLAAALWATFLRYL